MMKKKDFTINFCKLCLYSDRHPLGLLIDDEGICSGCSVHEEKNQIDWPKKFNELKIIVSKYKKNSDNYDCIVPISGAQDSYFIIDTVKNKLNLNPLLVCYNKYFNTKLGIQNLANLRIKFNCDIIYQNVNPLKVKKIIQNTFREFGSIYWPILAGHSNFPVQIANKYKIPLIIWGAHQGLEQVGMFSHLNKVEMTRRYRKEHDLLGHEAENLLSSFNTLSKNDINNFIYPSHKDIFLDNIRGIYLGNYIRWDPKAQHEQMIKKYGYRTTKLSRTFDTYDHVDCFNYINIHDTLKLYKHGYSKVTDHATREIRHKRISREEGINLVRKFELNNDLYRKQFCNWLSISENSLNFLLNQNRNPDYWEKKDHKNWKFKGWSTYHNKSSSNSEEKFEKSYIITEKKKPNLSEHYITVGKGYP